MEENTLTGRVNEMMDTKAFRIWNITISFIIGAGLTLLGYGILTVLAVTFGVLALEIGIMFIIAYYNRRASEASAIHPLKN